MFDVDFSPNSRILVAASSDGTARTWIIPRAERNSIMALHETHVRRAVFGENADSVLTASRDGTARTWKVVTGGPRAVFRGHTDTVTAAVFAPGDMIATASLDGTVRTWIAQLQPDLRPTPSLAAPRPTVDPGATVDGANVTLRLDGRRELTATTMTCFPSRCRRTGRAWSPPAATAMRGSGTRGRASC